MNQTKKHINFVVLCYTITIIKRGDIYRNVHFIKERIPGIVHFGRAWAISSDAVSPVDGRITTGEHKNWRKNMSDRICHWKMIRYYYAWRY